MAVVIALAWSATASTKLSATESETLSETESVGPTSREQLRLADAIWTLGDTPSINAVANRMAQNSPHFSVAQNDSSSASEEVPACQPRRDRCYVNSPLSTLRVNIESSTGILPENVAAQCRAATPARQDQRMVDGWAGFEKRWSATCMYHQPLYFEEINAERYGYTPGYCIQPLVSAGHFFATIPALPYLMIAQSPSECIYTLGHYRPGSCAPYRNSRRRMRLSAGVAEAVTVVALIALIP